ncbi:hypothetical protein HNY73_003336 [Argiope bruennichi]|uniref:Uncharacterized protein n=1 Tax=Argiope bruennichi TaxID=94029 RepID=A0A8T0FXL1_ARGBR|nr:hypothetical protein HNY73_003336 [Argiope bruennichi]
MGRYDKEKKIIHALIKTFLGQKCISQANSTNLRNIVDTSDEVFRGLKSLGEEASGRDPWLIHLLLQKLDPETRRFGYLKTSKIEFPTWEEFLEFLNIRCSSLELMVYNESDAKILTKTIFVACENNQRNKTDKNYSQVVLSWLSSPPRNWKPVVANRTSEILDLIPQNRWRSKSNMSKQKLGDLPERRLTINKPFFVCGIDYAGPISIMKHRGRLAKTTKDYIVVFVCFATKTLHLELVTDYLSEYCIAALILYRCFAQEGAHIKIFIRTMELIF